MKLRNVKRKYNYLLIKYVIIFCKEIKKLQKNKINVHNFLFLVKREKKKKVCFFRSFIQ